MVMFRYVSGEIKLLTFLFVSTRSERALPPLFFSSGGANFVLSPFTAWPSVIWKELFCISWGRTRPLSPLQAVNSDERRAHTRTFHRIFHEKRALGLQGSSSSSM